ncbi:MAG: isoprenylcysteine carboxylmethyltransferase family protein [Pseudomonadota bacterium]
MLATYLPLVPLFGPVFRAAGLALVVVGFGLIGWSALWFWRKKTTIEPHHTPGTLIIEGPYRLSRNPIYLGMMAILVGYVLHLGVLSPVLLPFALYHVLQTRFVLPEEALLRETFGAEGERYIHATRRWI